VLDVPLPGAARQQRLRTDSVAKGRSIRGTLHPDGIGRKAVSECTENWSGAPPTEPKRLMSITMGKRKNCTRRRFELKAE